MPEVGRWNGHIFEVSGKLVRSFSGLTIKAGCETEDKTSSKQKYVSRKAGNAAEVSFSVALLRSFGCDVRAEADAFLADAAAGAKDYFYVGDGKLLPCQLMLTQAEVSEIEIGASGNWNGAALKLTMKQADKGDGKTASGGSGGSSTGNKKSVNTAGLIATSTGTAAAKSVGSKVAEKAKTSGNTGGITPGTGTISAGGSKLVDATKAIQSESARLAQVKETSKQASLNTTGYFTTASGTKIPIMSTK